MVAAPRFAVLFRTTDRWLTTWGVGLVRLQAAALTFWILRCLLLLSCLKREAATPSLPLQFDATPVLLLRIHENSLRHSRGLLLGLVFFPSALPIHIVIP